jgi:ATP-binding cassette, subfamily B, multidrug efflux pump
VLTRLIRVYTRPYRRSIALVVVLQLAQAIATLFLPTLNARLIDEGVGRGDTGAILGSGGVMLAFVALQLICAGVAGYVAARTAMSIGRDLRADVFGRALMSSAREIAHFGAPSLLTRTMNDVQQVQSLVYMSLTGLAATPMMFTGGIVMALGLEPRLAALPLAALPAMLGVLGLVLYRLRTPFRAMQECLDLVNRVLREQIMGVRVTRAFVRDDHEGARFAEANARLTATAVQAARLMATMFPAGMLIANLAAVAAVWAGAHLIDDGSAQPGTIIAFMNYLALILGSAMLATFTVLMAPRAQVSAARIGEVLGTRTGRTGAAAAVPAAVPAAAPTGRGDIEVRGVSFSYPGAEAAVLDGVSLVARPGETTAIIGSTGAGKTSLLNLIAGLFDPTAGAVLINGVDVRHLNPGTLVRTVGLAPQRSYLFSGTVASNLRYGRPEATDAELWHALEVAQARDFVEALPDGLGTEVGQGGANFSGGQRQRLAIAISSTCSTTPSPRSTCSRSVRCGTRWPTTPGKRPW